MLGDELDRLESAQGFVDAAADGEVVDGRVVEDAVRGDDVEASEGEARVLVEAWNQKGRRGVKEEGGRRGNGKKR